MTDELNLTHEEKRAVLDGVGYEFIQTSPELSVRWYPPREFPRHDNKAFVTQVDAIDAAWAHDEPRRLRERIAALEAENAALREQTAAPKRVWMLYSSDGYDVFSVIAIYANKESAEKQAGKENADELAFLLEYGDPDCFDHPISEADVLDKRSVKEYEVLP